MSKNNEIPSFFPNKTFQNAQKDKGFLIKSHQKNKKSEGSKFNQGLLDFLGHSYNNNHINNFYKSNA